jgi:hypothetical protein
MKEKLQGSLQSLTIWFNVFMAQLPASLDYAQQHLPLLHDYLPAPLYAWAFVVSIVGNILLRFFKTEVPLEEKPLPVALKEAKE